MNLHFYYEGKNKQPKLEEMLNLLASGFIKGGFGFLKSSTAGEMIKGSAAINREIRVGVTHVRFILIWIIAKVIFNRII